MTRPRWTGRRPRGLRASRRRSPTRALGPAVAGGGPGDRRYRPGGLTPREAQVLRLVAGGATNRGIAATLVISEKTVAHHLNNMFVKLGVSTRTEAAAYAYEHVLI
ncbi:response regulator transcription factor [Streptomyces sp. NPDC002845]